ncbi:MAG: type II secretion system F family protein [Actinobacteria bacterium]|nr:MAG: type II secretion system F family protein [Actinomycetota bacterium]
MATYVYTVKDRSGKAISGSLEGDNAAAVSAKLRQMGYIIVKLTEKSEGLNVSFGKPKAKKVKGRDLTIFSRQFATMVNSGLSLTKCLSILSQQSESAALRTIVTDIGKDVEGGQSLSDSMGKHPKTFPPIFVNMVRAGETGGVLDEVLMRVADHFEKESQLKSKIKSAMAYPMAMFSMSMLILFAMITFVVPVFVNMFAQLGGDLPLPTQVLVTASDFIRSRWYVLIVVIGGSVWGFKSYKATKGGRYNIDKVKLHLPIMGKLTVKIALAKFTRTFGTLISSGVPILSALDIVADTSGNELVAEAVKKTRAGIKEGETISKPLGESAVFPPMVVQMISVGEETGALDSMLNKIADFYDAEVSASVDALTSLIEPLMIAFMGMIIGGIIIALYMPMFKMFTLIK